MPIQIIKNRKFLLKLVGIILLAVILSKVDWGHLYASLMNVPAAYLVITVPLVVVTALVRSWRWRYILHKLNVRLSLWRSFIYYSVSFFWGTVTPGRVGEFSRALYLKEDGVKTGTAFFSIFFDRFLDLCFLSLASVAAILLILDMFSPETLLVVTAALVFLCAFVFFFRKRLLYIVKDTLFFILPDGFHTRAHGYLKEVQDDISGVTFGSLFAIVILLVISWFCQAVPLCLLGWGMKLGVSMSVLLIAIFLSSAISMLPISVGGIGTRDGFLIFYLGRQGIAMEDALTFSLMFLYVYIVALAIGYLSYLWKQHAEPGKPATQK